jgi:hypothetical protein
MNYSVVRLAVLFLTLAATSALAQTQPSLASTRAQHRGFGVVLRRSGEPGQPARLPWKHLDSGEIDGPATTYTGHIQ